MINGAHLHLLLNHIPVLGAIFAWCLIVYGVFFKNSSLANAGLVTLIICAMVSIPVYLSGEEAEHAVDGMIGVSLSAIEVHEEQAEIAFWVMLMTGAIALGTLLSSWESRKPSVPLLWINVVFLFISMLLMARAAYSGGMIHHPEISATASAVENEEPHHDE